MTVNKKVINATATTVDNIDFKSKLEALVYKTLIDKGFQPFYEVDEFTLFEGFKPTQCLKDGKVCRKEIGITYTPDFKIIYKGITVYIEVKGFCNDVYPYKRKLFLNLIKNNPNIYFFEVHSKKGLIACIDKLNQLYE